MASVTWTCNKDSRIADNGSNLGAGASDFNPVGTYSGFQYRTLLGFPANFSGMVSITSAILHIRTSTQFYVAFGSDPDIAIRRISGSWSEGTATSMSGSNAVVFPGPAVTGTRVTADISTSESTWVTVDITTILQEALAANSFLGLQLVAWNGSAESSSSTDVTEFYSREQGSSDPYIVVTYTTNVAPSAPTGLAPTTRQVTTDPTFTGTHVDSDGDALLKYDLQVSTDSTFASVTNLNASQITTGITGNAISAALSAIFSGNVNSVEVALSRGTTYYWRLRTYSSAGVLTAGAWCATQSFRVNALNVVTAVSPASTGQLLHLLYTAGSGWASPRLYAEWSNSDADGDAQTKYRVVVYESTTSGGAYSSVYDSGQVASAVTNLTVPLTLNESRYYKVYVDTYDGYEWTYGGTGGTTGLLMGAGPNRARWGVGTYRYDMGGVPTSLSLNTLATTTGASSYVAVEYGTNTSSSAPSSYYATLAEAGLNQWLHYRVWLLAWGASPATSPSLDALAVNYSATVIVPDDWTRSDTVRIFGDSGDYVYGTQSLKVVANAGNNVVASQLIQVQPNTDYVLSARIKAQGNPDAFVAFSSGAVTGAIAFTTHLAATTGWQRYSVAWNSGSATSVYIVCRSGTASSGTAYAWFDAIKVEASTVVSAWQPGFVGTAVTIDAGGVQIDASAGGVFRLRGSTGGTDDRVDLGGNGLTIGSHSARINAAIRVAKRRMFR